MNTAKILHNTMNVFYSTKSGGVGVGVGSTALFSAGSSACNEYYQCVTA